MEAPVGGDCVGPVILASKVSTTRPGSPIRRPEHGATLATLATTDRDFARFRGLRSVDPLSA